MLITWYGHSCFKVAGSRCSVIFDPFEPGYVPGFTLPEVSADYCFCSHGHGDHNYEAGVTLSSNPPELTWFEIDTFHDEKQGSLRGTNRITVVEIDGKRIAHMGDIGHELSPKQLEELGNIDILMIPVGGYYTVDSSTAKRIVNAIGPKITLPMHFRGEGFGFDVISPLKDYASLCDDLVFVSASSFDPEEVPSPATIVLDPPVNN